MTLSARALATTLCLALTLLAPLSSSLLAQDGHGADSSGQGASPAAEDDHTEHQGHSRAGDASLFMELFSHLEPHAVSAVWIGGDKGFGLVDAHLYDSHGEPVIDSHGAHAAYHTPADLTEALSAEMGGGSGYLIYNINTVMWMAGLALVLVFLPVARRARSRSGQAPKGALYGLMESLFLFVRDEMVYSVLGKEGGRRFLPLFLTQFFFILFMNLLGLMPLGGFGGTATANLAVTGGLAMTTLLGIHLGGMKEHGLVPHFKNFIPHGLPWYVLPIIVPVEVLGMVVKPAALTIRLFANLTAGHLIVLGLFGLVYFFDSGIIAVPVMGMGIAIYCLELFVCFVQAYIFTYLSIVFLGASLAPDH